MNTPRNFTVSRLGLSPLSASNIILWKPDQTEYTGITDKQVSELRVIIAALEFLTVNVGSFTYLQLKNYIEKEARMGNAWDQSSQTTDDILDWWLRRDGLLRTSLSITQ